MSLTAKQRAEIVQIAAEVSCQELTEAKARVEAARVRMLTLRHYLDTMEANLLDAEQALDDAELGLYNVCRDIVQDLEPAVWH